MRLCDRVGVGEREGGLMGVGIFLVGGRYVGFGGQYVFVVWVVFVLA